MAVLLFTLAEEQGPLETPRERRAVGRLFNELYAPRARIVLSASSDGHDTDVRHLLLHGWQNVRASGVRRRPPLGRTRYRQAERSEQEGKGGLQAALIRSRKTDKNPIGSAQSIP